MTHLSIFLTVFDRPTVEERLDAARAAGFSGTHFDQAVLGGPTLPAVVDEPALARVAERATARGMSWTSVEATYNMAHPDERVRADGRRALAALIEAAPVLGSPVLSLCTGSRDDHMWTRHRDNASPQAWADMTDEMAAAAEVAERSGVVLGVECEYSNVVSSAPLARRLLDDLASPAVKIVLDAANLVPPGQHGRQRELLEDAFTLLGDDIAVAHAKDITEDGTFVAAGTGLLDYPLFLGLLDECDFDGPLILHSLTEADVPAALALLRGQPGR